MRSSLVNEVGVTPVRLADYEGIVPDDQLEEIHGLAKSLRGLSVIHLNSTADGGGVAEILRSFVPLMRDVGLDASWHVIEGNDEFFGTTKKMHNQLQGAEGDMSSEEWNAYIDHVHSVGGSIISNGLAADAWFMHDPQTLPLGGYLPQGSPRTWICHIDTTNPNPELAERVIPLMGAYDSIMFSLDEFVPGQLEHDRVRIAPPAIDPLRMKNRPPAPDAVREALSRIGIDTQRPLISQLARFDRWKDPWGVIDAYRMVKKEIPGLQLALAGVITAKDDPEAWDVVVDVRKYAGSDPDIHIYDDPAQVGDLEVAALQTGSDVVLQKSLREGFGLSVTEALWKGTPTIAGRCGGIRQQIDDGRTGFLVGSVDECADKILLLLKDREFAAEMGAAGKEFVRERFLLPRLLRDYMRVIDENVNGASSVAATTFWNEKRGVLSLASD